MRLGRIGFDNTAGYLEGGMMALENHPELQSKIKRITAQDLADMLAGPEKPFVLDVRSEKEHTSGHITGSVNIPLVHLEENLARLPKTGPLVVHCEGGYRSAIATGLLQKHGFNNVLDLVGGYKAWAGCNCH